MLCSKLNNESVVRLCQGINADNDRASFVLARIIDCADEVGRTSNVEKLSFDTIGSGRLLNLGPLGGWVRFTPESGH